MIVGPNVEADTSWDPVRFFQYKTVILNLVQKICLFSKGENLFVLN